jgi:uncharacterized protein YjbI with pentapeptide repeats
MKIKLLKSFLTITLFLQYSLFAYNFEHLKKVERGDQDLQNLDLSGALLQNMDLAGKNLTGTDLSCANLFRTNFTDAKLINAILKNAFTLQANFYRADLSNTNLNVLTAAQACFINATGISKEQKDFLLSMDAIFDKDALQKINNYEQIYEITSEKKSKKSSCLKRAFYLLCCCKCNSDKQKIN